MWTMLNRCWKSENYTQRKWTPITYQNRRMFSITICQFRLAAVSPFINHFTLHVILIKFIIFRRHSISGFDGILYNNIFLLFLFCIADALFFISFSFQVHTSHVIVGWLVRIWIRCRTCVCVRVGTDSPNKHNKLMKHRPSRVSCYRSSKIAWCKSFFVRFFFFSLAVSIS